MNYILAILLMGFAIPAWADAECRLAFTLKNRWVPVVAGKGDGTITCDDGTSIPVRLRIYGGWFTVFKKELIESGGSFSPVKDPQKLLGRYTVSLGNSGTSGQNFFSPTVWKQGISFTFDKKEGEPQLGLTSGTFRIMAEKK